MAVVLLLQGLGVVCRGSCVPAAMGWDITGLERSSPQAGVLGNCGFPGEPASQVSFPAPASSLGIVSHHQQQKTRPRQQLGAAPGHFFHFFFSNFTEMGAAADLL